MRHRVSEVDKDIGRRLRHWRLLAGMTQNDLAKLIGKTYQQVHKYETGVNRVSVAALLQLLAALEVSVYTFLSEIETPLPLVQRDRQTIAVVQCFRMLGPDLQTGVLDLLRKMTRTNDTPVDIETQPLTLKLKERTHGDQV